MGTLSIESLQAQVDSLRGHLTIALRQWAMYAEMVEAPVNGRFDIAKEPSPEGELYRDARAALSSTESK